MTAEKGAPFVVQTRAGGKWATAARCQGEAEARKAFDQLVSPPALEHTRIIVGAYSTEKGKVVYKLVTEVDPSTETVSGEAAPQAAFSWSDVDAKKAGQGIFALAFWGLVLWYGGGWVWEKLSTRAVAPSGEHQLKSANSSGTTARKPPVPSSVPPSTDPCLGIHRLPWQVAISCGTVYYTYMGDTSKQDTLIKNGNWDWSADRTGSRCRVTFRVEGIVNGSSFRDQYSCFMDVEKYKSCVEKKTEHLCAIDIDFLKRG